MTDAEVIEQAIADFDSIEAAIKRKGVDVPKGTDTKEYGALIDSINTMPATLLLKDENGNEAVAVFVKEETVFTATENDIRAGTVAATENGVVTGTKDIPSYHTTEGTEIITSGKKFEIKNLEYLETYKYTKLQAIICDYNTNLNNSVSANKVAINNNVYDVQSVIPLATITIDEINKTIDFGITNETDKPKIIRYFTYKEIE